jgi:hypothetical protein
VSTEQIEHGELENGGYRVLVLPDSCAVSTGCASSMKTWHESLQDGKLKLVASSDSPAVFDQHGSGREEGAVALSGPSISFSETQRIRELAGSRITETIPDESRFRETVFFQPSEVASSYAKARLSAVSRQHFPGNERLADDLRFLKPQVVTSRDLCIRTHRYRLGNARLLAFERGVDYHMSEDLKQAGGNESLEKAVSFSAKLVGTAHVYDLRSGAYLGQRNDIPVDLDPWKPSLFALLPEKLPEGRGVAVSLLKCTEENGS